MKKENEIRNYEEIKMLATSCFNQIIEDAENGVKYGFKAVESIPAVDYRCIEIDGVVYQLRIAVDLIAEKIEKDIDK